MLHDDLKSEIGQPAVIPEGSLFPEIRIMTEFNGSCEGELIYERTDSVLEQFSFEKLQNGKSTYWRYPYRAELKGTYRLDLELTTSTNDTALYDSFFFSVLDKEASEHYHSEIVYPVKGNLVYIPDFKGNRIPDFSTAGYGGGDEKIPEVDREIVLSPTPGDDTERIQKAIDNLAALPTDKDGLRGAILLKEGIYTIQSQLKISKSGIILRGEGQGSLNEMLLTPSQRMGLEPFISSLADFEGTVLIATGEKSRTLIDVEGKSGAVPDSAQASPIIDHYVPVGANSFRVADPGLFSVGDSIIVDRFGNKEWIQALGMDKIPPRPGGRASKQWEPFHLRYETRIADIQGNKIFIEGSLMIAIEAKWGGGRIYGYHDRGRIKNVGIEDLRGISYWKPNGFGIDDTRHADQFINFINSKDSWVRNVSLEHFFSMQGAIQVSYSSTQVTIDHSSTLVADKKYYSGPQYRSNVINAESNVYVGRYGFHLQGQSNLVKSCYTLNNRHSFVVGARVMGPNVFLFCEANNSITWSEPHQRWSVGGLYDNVRDDISLMNRLYYGSGHGWSGANYVAWNTRGELICMQPPTAQNWAIGHEGIRSEGPFDEYGEKGYWENIKFPLRPESLYLQQLQDRKGEDQVPNVDFPFARKKDDLLQNKNSVIVSPHPAAFYTIFSYKLRKAANVKLDIYSNRGKLLKTKDFGNREAGEQEFFLENIGREGQILKDGLYVFRLVVGNKAFSGKLVISLF
ncbi:MAG: hypothetical protein ACOCXD_00820 [Bacteroidota bacterium]